MLAAMASWFTPTMLFCLMNLVIATLFFSYKKPVPDPTRPASIFQRVRSITFSSYAPDPTQNPTFIQRVRSVNLSIHDRNPTETPSLLQRVRSITRPDPNPTHHHRTESEPVDITRPDPDFEETVSAPAMMRKSASVRVRQPEEVAEVRRPATTREKKAAAYGEDDEEVDEKADDFINKFKQQLKLQRMDSLLRYKEMLHRGASR